MGAGEQMGVLEDDAQGPAEAFLADVPDIDAIVGDQPVFNFIEPVAGWLRHLDYR